MRRIVLRFRKPVSFSPSQKAESMFTVIDRLSLAIDRLSLAIAAIAEAILMRISAEQVPSLHRIAPRYLKLVTPSNFWLFMLISAWTFWVLLVMILLFSMLLLIPLTLALSSSLLVIS